MSARLASIGVLPLLWWSFGITGGAASPPEPAPQACVNECNHHGACLNGKCLCEPGWEGEHCGKASACPKGCSGHGKCVAGKCFCEPGWEGDGCGKSVDCPNDCSGNGKCLNGVCFCRPGFGGKDCSKAL